MATLWSAKFGLERRGRHHSPPPKPVTAASALRNSGAQRVVSVLNESFAVRIIPLKPSPDKVFSGGRPAREPVLGSGGELDSAGQVGRLTTAPHFEKRCPDARVFYCGTGLPMTQKSLQNQPVPQFEQRHRRRSSSRCGSWQGPVMLSSSPTDRWSGTVNCERKSIRNCLGPGLHECQSARCVSQMAFGQLAHLISKVRVD
jgi:hypothetical protein